MCFVSLIRRVHKGRALKTCENGSSPKVVEKNVLEVPSKGNPSKIFRVLSPNLLEQLLAGVIEPQLGRPMKA